MMEGSNNRWAPVHGDVGEVNSTEWRSQLQSEARQRIVNKIMDTLKKHLPISGNEGLGELKKIAVRFEEKIYTAATSQSDYLRKISMKMLTMEQKTHGGGVNGNSLSSTSGAVNQSSDPVNLMQPQVRNQGPSMQVPVTNQSQSRQLLAQNLQSNISSTTVQGSGGLSPALTSITGMTQPNISSLGQNQNMHAMPGIAQNSVNNIPGQSIPQNMYASSQRQMPGRHQQQSIISQHQQSQNHILYQQQLIKQKMQQSSLLQSQIPQQQQQQPVMSQNQLQSSQQPLIQISSGLQSNQIPLQHSQPSMIQSVSQSGIQQNQQNSVQQSASSLHQQHPQSLARQQQSSQQPNLHQQTSSLMQQQPTSISQQSNVLPSHQQQIMGHQSSLASIQQNQLLGQHNNISDLQQQQLHHQRLSNQQNGLMSMQQPQQMINQQNISLHQQQQMPQSNVSGMQQQSSLQSQHQSQMLGSAIPASNMQSQNPNFRSHSKASGQHLQQTSPVLITQAQSSQQLIPQLQTQAQAAHLQQQMGLQQMHRRIHGPASILQSQITTEQKPQFQSQRVLSEAPSTSVDSTGQTSEPVPEWQEEVYQKILSLKEAYYPDLNEMSQKLGLKLQQEHLLQSGSVKQAEQLENMKKFKSMLDRLIQMLLMSRQNIPLGMKDKIQTYEKQIVGMLTNRPRKGFSQSQQQLQHTGGQNLAMSQSPSQVSQLQQADSQLNQISQSQSGSLPLSTQTGVPTTQQNIMSSMQSGANIESGNALSSAQKGAIGSFQVGGLGTLQQGSIGASLQNNVSLMQNNANPLQRNALQHQVKQEHQQHPFVIQKKLQQQLIQQRLQQQQPQHQQLQQKQQQNIQLQGGQMQQHHPINEMNELNTRQISNIKPVPFQSSYQIGQRQTYYQQQPKIPTSFPISSPQSIPIPSPQISQHSSPQIDQQPLLSSISKSLTPLQSVSSPVVDPSSPVPSTQQIDHEKQLSNISSLSNPGNTVPQQSGPIVQSLADFTPGISSSSMLDGKINATERPLDYLLRMVGSSSPNLLASSASDIGSVINMIDQIAGSAPGNGSRAAVGEDLVAMTKCRMQARNFMSQDVGSATKKMKRHTSAMPLNVVSSAGSVHDSLKQTSIDTSEFESTATSRIKRAKIEANHALLEEIRFINQQLIDTSVDVTDEDIDSISSTTDGEGTVVKFTYLAISLSPTLKSQFAASRVSPILPLLLFIPPSYPCCSPVLLDKISVEMSNESEDLSVKVKSLFSSSLRGLSSPMCLKEMARSWDVCVRTVVSEFAQLSGGGTFS